MISYVDPAMVSTASMNMAEMEAASRNRMETEAANMNLGEETKAGMQNSESSDDTAQNNPQIKDLAQMNTPSESDIQIQSLLLNSQLQYPAETLQAAKAALAQPEARPLILTRFEMLEAYAKGKLCLSCDSHTHRMPSCPYGEFVCPNCHRSSHRGEECPLRCRFCQCLHPGVSITVCIKQCREFLEQRLGLQLPLREQYTSPVSSRRSKFGSSLGDRPPTEINRAALRPNTAFGRSVYISNLPMCCTVQLLTQAVQRLLTKGDVELVELHGRHAFVQLTTLEAAFEVVEKRRLLQVLGMTLKVQFKKTGMFSPTNQTGTPTTENASFSYFPNSSNSSDIYHSTTNSSATGSLFNPSPSSVNHSQAHNLRITSFDSNSSREKSLANTNSAGNRNTSNPSPTSLSSYTAFVAPPAPSTPMDISRLVAAKLKQDLLAGRVVAQTPSSCPSKMNYDPLTTGNQQFSPGHTNYSNTLRKAYSMIVPPNPKNNYSMYSKSLESIYSTSQYMSHCDTLRSSPQYPDETSSQAKANGYMRLDSDLLEKAEIMDTSLYSTLSNGQRGSHYSNEFRNMKMNDSPSHYDGPQGCPMQKNDMYYNLLKAESQVSAGYDSAFRNAQDSQYKEEFMTGNTHSHSVTSSISESPIRCTLPLGIHAANTAKPQMAYNTFPATFEVPMYSEYDNQPAKPFNFIDEKQLPDGSKYGVDYPVKSHHRGEPKYHESLYVNNEMSRVLNEKGNEELSSILEAFQSKGMPPSFCNLSEISQEMGLSAESPESHSTKPTEMLKHNTSNRDILDENSTRDPMSHEDLMNLASALLKETTGDLSTSKQAAVPHGDSTVELLQHMLSLLIDASNPNLFEPRTMAPSSS